LSLTLRDAQYAAWKIFNKINAQLDPQRGTAWDPFVTVTCLLEEAGEVASAVKGLEGFKPPDKPKTKEMLAQELTDLLYAVFVLAEHYGVNLEETYLEHVNNYLLRLLT
jgi:NTP pyrophosphatase (non-canonical NTP hydrolase)